MDRGSVRLSPPVVDNMSYFYTLRFETEADALAIAESLRLLPDDTGELPSSIVIQQPAIFGQAQVITDAQVPAVIDPETGEELTPPILIPGVFLNVCLSRNALPSDLRRRRVPYGSGGMVFCNSEPEPGAWPPS